MAKLPADACPHPRPFPTEFAECPLYEARRYAPADSEESPLGLIWRTFNKHGVTHQYAACQFGGRAARGRLILANGLKRLVAAL
jgi:hypothetical protein